MRPTRVYTAEGIVIKRRSIGEGDRMVTLYTKRYGKLRVLARGVRKISSRRAPHIEVFNHVIATIHKGQHLETLTEVSPLETFENIRGDLTRIGAAYYLCELVDGLLPEAQVHEDVFTLMRDALSALGRVQSDRVNVLRDRFASALLGMLGFLEKGKKPPGKDLNSYVEHLLERRLKTVRLASQLDI